MINLDEMVNAYIAAALFTELEDLPSGEFDPSPHWGKVSDDFKQQARDDCQTFVALAAADDLPDNACKQWANLSEILGHDFWLTRNGHGSGFWDGDWQEPYAEQLDEIAKSMGECEAYWGDDGLLYA